MRYFLTIAREGSFSRAAQVLHISQPTLSKQIKELEARLDTTLFIRGKSVELTETGMYLKARAAEILQLLDSTESYFSSLDQISGTIYIGTGEFHTMLPVFVFMKDFQTRYPEVRYQIVSGNGDMITEQISQGLLDIGFLLEPQMEQRFTYHRLPLTESWGILTPKDHPLAGQKTVSLEDLKGQKLIVPSENSSFFQLDANFSLEQVNISARYNLIFNATLMVEAGMGVAICLNNLVELEQHPRLCFIPFEPALSSGIYLCLNEYPGMPRLISLFVKEMIESQRRHQL